MTNQDAISFKALFIWGLCAVFFTYEFMLRTVLGTFEHPLLQDLQLSLVTFSILSSTAYQTAYGIMQIPVGIIFDKYGLKKVLTLAILFCAFSVIAFGMTKQFDSAFVFRVLMGLGSSFGFIAVLVVVYDWIPSSKTGLFIGLSQLVGTLGPMLAAGPLNAAAESGGLSWRFIFMILGLFGIGLAIAVFAFVDNNRDYTGGFQILQRATPLRKILSSLIRQPQVWFIGLYSAAIYFTIEYLSENSGKAFLALHGYSSQTASNFITLSWFGYALGCPLLGWLSDLLCRRKIVLITSAVICLMSGLLIIYAAASFWLVSLGFLALGIGASGQSVAFATIAEQCAASYRAAGLGFNNACIVIIASINTPLIAWFLNRFKEKTGSLAIHDYQTAFIIVLISMIISLVTACFFIKETYCKSVRVATELEY